MVELTAAMLVALLAVLLVASTAVCWVEWTAYLWAAQMAVELDSTMAGSTVVATAESMVASKVSHSAEPLAELTVASKDAHLAGPMVVSMAVKMVGWMVG